MPGVQHCLIPLNCRWILTFLDWVSRCSLIAFVTVDLPLHGIPVITISGIFWAEILSNWFQWEKVTIPTNNLFSGKMKNQIGKLKRLLECFFSGIPFYKIILINITNKNKTMTKPMVNSKIITVVLFLVLCEKEQSFWTSHGNYTPWFFATNGLGLETSQSCWCWLKAVLKAHSWLVVLGGIFKIVCSNLITWYP